MNIYFSHATSDYNSKYENKCLELIISKYPEYGIINPKDIIISDQDKKKLMGKFQDYTLMMEKYYFSEIYKCEILIAFKQSKNKKYSHGVTLEIAYAEQNEIKVLEW